MNEAKYYVSLPDNQMSKVPFSVTEIREMRTCGALTARRVVWCEGMAEPVRVDDFLAEQGKGAGGWGLVAAFRSCLRRYAKFSGRASRAEYWWFQLSLFLVLAVVLALSYLLLLCLPDELDFVALALPVLTIPAFVLPSLTLLVRRLHDTGFSGWWVLLAFVPAVGGLTVFLFTLLPSINVVNKYGFGPAGPEA